MRKCFSSFSSVINCTTAAETWAWLHSIHETRLTLTFKACRRKIFCFLQTRRDLFAYLQWRSMLFSRESFRTKWKNQLKWKSPKSSSSLKLSRSFQPRKPVLISAGLAGRAFLRDAVIYVSLLKPKHFTVIEIIKQKGRARGKGSGWEISRFMLLGSKAERLTEKLTSFSSPPLGLYSSLHFLINASGRVGTETENMSLKRLDALISERKMVKLWQSIGIIRRLKLKS